MPALDIDCAYKYLKRNHADLLISKGGIRLGTFAYYRQFEITDLARADRMEGKKITRSMPTYKHIEGAATPAEFQGAIEFGPGSGGTTFENISFAKPHISEDAYIYCISATKSSRLLTEFKADICIEIFDLGQFGLAIQRELIRRRILKRESTTHLVGCKYFPESTIPFGLQIPAAVVKDDLFASQDEYRYIHACNTNGRFLDLELPRIKPFCRIVNL